MRTFLLAGSTLLALAVSVAVPTAQAAYIVTFSQAGSNVVADGSGTIDTSGLTFFRTFRGQLPFVAPSVASEATGATGTVDAYQGAISGPSSFGSGPLSAATTSTGDIVALVPLASQISVPMGYVSGASLSDTATYAGQTFASLGLDPGNYVYSFGSGANVDTFTVDIVAPPSVPEPASLALFGTGVLGLGLIRRRRRG